MASSQPEPTPPPPKRGILKGFSGGNKTSSRPGTGVSQSHDATSGAGLPSLKLSSIAAATGHLTANNTGANAGSGSASAKKGRAWAQSQSYNQNLPGAMERELAQRERGLEFIQPTQWWSWERIKRKLLLASTGSPSSVERQSETSEASGHSRQAAYVRNGAAAAGGGQAGASNEKQVHMEGDEEDWTVDQIVVDSEFWDADGNLLAAQDPDSNGHTGNTHERTSNSGRDTTTAHSDTAGSLLKAPHYKAIDGFVTFFKGWLFPKCQYFFEPRFGDPEKEEAFRKERWYNNKRHAFFGCCFLIINWALICGLVTMYSTFQSVLYYGVFTLFTWPLPIMVALDWNRKHNMIYSINAAAATLCLGYFGVISMWECHFLRQGRATCGGQTFLLVTYYSTALPVIGLFALQANRLCMFIGQLGIFGLVCGTLLMDSAGYARNFVNFILFSGFIQYLHYAQEKVDRRMFTLRMQLKISYRAQQKAQINEKKANASKRRFISYIFHEVRVPLNTAYLAFQNLQGTAAFDNRDEDQMVEVYALESSLQQVQQVLNDVLDLQRMDAGRFEQNNQPFHFHRAINALVAGLKVATAAKRLSLDVDLDNRIDNLPQSVDWNGSKATFVIGDEIRLRQVLTNIASNSCKFNPEGKGGIRVSTRLIYPEIIQPSPGLLDLQKDNNTTHTWLPGSDHDGITPVNEKHVAPDSVEGTDTTFVSRLSHDKEKDLEKGPDPDDIVIRPSAPGRVESDSSEDSADRMARRDCVIIRIEISDCGTGIKPSDMVGHHIFSAFAQTETGRVQGGKGTGLGLAIVRSIVQLAGGRLGVKSSRNGSTFWFEFRYPLATASEVLAQEPPTPLSFVSSSPLPRPVRPPVKPYKDGESSYSQYSASRLEAAMAGKRSIPPSPMAEKDRPFSSLSLGQPTSIASARAHASDSRNASGSISSLPSANDNLASPSGALNAIDTVSPFTSEQWNATISGNRSILPAMSVTGATPPSIASRTNVSLLSRVSPTPSPPLFDKRGSHEMVEFSSNTDRPRTASTSNSGRPMTQSSTTPRAGTSMNPITAEGESPVGEEAFTPMARAQAGAGDPSPMQELGTAAALSGVAMAGSPLSVSTSSAGADGQTPTGADRPLLALVVDDDPLTRKLMGRMMTRLGCKVEETENGQLFLDILLGNPAEGKQPRYFDIVTLDNAMPVLTGEQAIRELRKAGRSDLVVGATGNALKSDQNAYIAAGVNHVLCKPISAKDIKAILALAKKSRDDREAADNEQLATPRPV